MTRHLREILMSRYGGNMGDGIYENWKLGEEVRSLLREAATSGEPLQLPRLLPERFKPMYPDIAPALPWAGCPEPRQESDEYICSCGLRWDTHEERPPCPKKL